jgi:hypothetical protein
MDTVQKHIYSKDTYCILVYTFHFGGQRASYLMCTGAVDQPRQSGTEAKTACTYAPSHHTWRCSQLSRETASPLFWIWGYHSGNYENYILLECNFM